MSDDFEIFDDEEDHQDFDPGDILEDEDHQDFDPGDILEDDPDDMSRFFDDEPITSLVQALRRQAQAQESSLQPSSSVDQTAIERTVQIRVSKRLADDPTLRRLLMKACQFGHKGVLDKLLDLGVKTTGEFSIEFKGYTPLLLAVKVCSNVEIVRTILDRDTTALKAQDKLPPLFLAVEEYIRDTDEEKRKKRKELIDFFLEQPDIRLDSPNKNKMTPIHVLCKYNHPDMLGTFLTAFSKQQPDLVTTMSWMKVFNSPNKDGWTPFMFAVKEHHVEVIEKLLSSCNPLECEQLCVPQNQNRMNAVLVAVQNGHLDLLKRMDSHITDQSSVYSTPNKTGLTVLHYVCCTGNPEILEWLLIEKESACKETINAKNKKGYTPLLTACQYQKNTLVRKLLPAGADPTIITEKGLSCLHLAAMHDSKESAEIAKALLDAGLDPMLQETKYGDTAYHTCCKQVNINVEDELRKIPEFESLKEVTNKDNKKAEDTRNTEVIPAAIRRRGPEYVEQYRKALKEGKTTIKRLQLLVLGEERVGKTSLIRSLLGKQFKEDCKPTQGIDMSDIELEQLYEHIAMGVSEDGDGAPWNTVKSSDYYESAVAKNLTAQTNKRVDWCQLALPVITPQSEEDMLADIQKIEDMIREQVRKESIPLRRSELLPRVRRRPAGPTPVVPQPRHAEPRVPSSDKRAAPDPPHNARPPRPTNPRPAPTNPATTPVPTPHPRSSPPLPRPPPPRSTISQSSARKIEKLSRTGKGKDPPLTFHTLDFAGQKLYRPMHHCFITQNAFYIVVFNLEDFVKWLNAKQEEREAKDPMIEIKYWLNNVYAHSSAEQRKIFLVGTHSASSLNGKQLGCDDLQRVHETLEEFITDEEDDRFLDSIVYKCHDGNPESCFFPVENSMTELAKGSRQESGIAALQKHITEQVEEVELPIKEERPVSWLKFEERLFRERNKRKDQPLSTTRGDLEKWAKECGVPDPLLAITFFHDTGVIIDQGLIPSAKCQSPPLIANAESLLVLLNPQWLAKIMTKVIELKVGKKHFDRKKLREFEKKGTIAIDVLKQCWKELLGENPDIVFDKILNVLETFFLLCPYWFEALYLVPSALPAAGPKDIAFTKECYTFYFEFPQYLPEEVYTHIVCLFLSFFKKSSTSLPMHELPKSEITSTCCKFCLVPDLMYNWKVTLLAAKRQLKVQASCPPNARDPPQSVIWFFHEQLLSVVCGENTMLGSLKYYGGPLVEKCPGCDRSSVLPFIKSHDKAPPRDSFICGFPDCPHEFYVGDLFGWKKSDQKSSEQPQGQASPSQSHVPVPQQIITNIIKEGAHATFQQTTNAPGQIVSGCTPHTLAGPPPAGAGVPSGSVTLPCDPPLPVAADHESQTKR